MTITLYKNLSESIVVNKNIQQIGVVTGTLRSTSSILNPTLAIEWNENIQLVNYIYINEFERYYYVGDIVSLINGMWEINCRVDVLMTYRDNIKQLNAVIARQELSYNLYLEDNRLLTTSRRIYTTLAFPNRVNPANVDDNAPSFIFTCAGGAETQTE